MKYLTDDQLQKLTPQRRRALLKSVNAKVGKQIDPDMLIAADKMLNIYRKKLRQMVQNDMAKDGYGSL